ARGGDWDARLLFDRTIAKAGIFPAVDPLLSWSRLLDNGSVSDEHRRVLLRVRDKLAAGGPAAERLRWFQSQPFFVAEPWTARDGVSVPLSQTIASYASLLEPQADALPL